VPETCILCSKTIKPLVLRWERKRVVRDARFVAQGAELKNDQEVIYFHWSCVEPPLRFVTHFQVPGYSSLTFEAKQTVREYFDKREKQNEKVRKKQKVNSASAVICDSCDKVCSDTMWHCMPQDDCDLCSKCYRWKSSEIQEEHAKHGTFERVATNQSFYCTNCSKTIKDSFFFCKDCPNGHYLCSNCFRRSRTKNHDAKHEFYAIGHSSKAQNSRQTAIVPHPMLVVPEGEISSDAMNDVETSTEHEEGNGNSAKLETNGGGHAATEEANGENATISTATNDDASEKHAGNGIKAEAKDDAGEKPAAANKDIQGFSKKGKSDAVTTTTSGTTKSSASSAPSSQSSIASADDRKRKVLSERSPPARATKRPKKMRLFVELNKKIREDFAKRFFLDKGLDPATLPKYADYMKAKVAADEARMQLEADLEDAGSVASRKKSAAGISIQKK